MKPKFFVTTPIYYSNSIPHIGHAYASFIADIIARYKRMNGFETKFSTWVDENSQKVVEKAKNEWLEIMEYADKMALKHKEIWDWLDISYTDFIRTTESRHFKLVQDVLKKSFDKWDIYEGIYEWMYCVGCESFKKPSDLNEMWCCPDHLTKPEIIKEKNWFFRLSNYQKEIEKLYENNSEFVIPNVRFNEVKEFLKWWLEDFSISRESNKFWIPLPFDPTQVTYVWYDALFNYVTVCVWKDQWFWPADLHIVWKDIIRFHAIFWPAMLLSAWYEIPKKILATWFFTIDWQKISKSLWNVIDPVEFSQKYSRDLMLLYLLSAFPIWQDWDFSQEQAITMYNAKLANNLWNLLNRFLVLWDKFFEQNEIDWVINDWINQKKQELIKKYFSLMDLYNLKDSLEAVFEFWDSLNKFLDETRPWNKNIEENYSELQNILYTLWEWLRIIAILLNPFFSAKMIELRSRIWLDYEGIEEINELLNKKEFFKIKEKWEPLYPRIIN